MTIVEGNNLISHYLRHNKPLLAGKIGITEMNILRCHHTNTYPEYLRHEVEDIAGLYPFNDKTTQDFAVGLQDALRIIDLIPVWNRVIPQFEQEVLNRYCPDAHRTDLQHLEPYFFDKPWTNHLKGKKIIVFSPFADSISRNFKQLDKIWNNKILPDFDLKTYRYPFALKISPNQKYQTSNDIYLEFVDILRKETFDVGIFGTGYTSLLFAAECKRLGKAGIHLGGATQILFGVKGQRWRDIEQFHPFFNEYWTDPLESERPTNRNLVEGGCYW